MAAFIHHATDPALHDLALQRDRIRGSIDVPLAKEGRDQAQARAQQFARKGPPHVVLSSNLGRAIETKNFILRANPTAVDGGTHASLRPWHIGPLEGQLTKNVLPIQKDLILNRPQVIPAGSSPKSTSAGESFNHFRVTRLRFLHHLISVGLKHPRARIVPVTHYRDIKLYQAHAKAGTPADLSVDPEEMLRHDGGPADVHYVELAGDGKILGIHALDMEGGDPLPEGLLVMRHGMTEWNGEAATPGDNESGGEEAQPA